MKILSRLSDAVAGWKLILEGNPDWRSRFTLTHFGMAQALVIFVFVAFLAVAFASTSMGLPGIFGVLAAMAVLSLPLIAVAITFKATSVMLVRRDPMIDFMVPATYMLAVFILVEGILAMTVGPVVMVSWLVLAYLLFRLARVATPWPVPVSVGFAVLSMGLLVAMRLALYMVSSTPA